MMSGHNFTRSHLAGGRSCGLHPVGLFANFCEHIAQNQRQVKFPSFLPLLLPPWDI